MVLVRNVFSAARGTRPGSGRGPALEGEGRTCKSRRAAAAAAAALSVAAYLSGRSFDTASPAQLGPDMHDEISRAAGRGRSGRECEKDPCDNVFAVNIESTTLLVWGRAGQRAPTQNRVSIGAVPLNIPPWMVRRPRPRPSADTSDPYRTLHHPSRRQVLVPFESGRAFWRRH